MRIWIMGTSLRTATERNRSCRNSVLNRFTSKETYSKPSHGLRLQKVKNRLLPKSVRVGRTSRRPKLRAAASSRSIRNGASPCWPSSWRFWIAWFDCAHPRRHGTVASATVVTVVQKFHNIHGVATNQSSRFEAQTIEPFQVHFLHKNRRARLISCPKIEQGTDPRQNAGMQTLAMIQYPLFLDRITHRHQYHIRLRLIDRLNKIRIGLDAIVAVTPPHNHLAQLLRHILRGLLQHTRLAAHHKYPEWRG